MNMPDRVPATMLTGLPGSGKQALLKTDLDRTVWNRASTWP